MEIRISFGPCGATSATGGSAGTWLHAATDRQASAARTDRTDRPLLSITHSSISRVYLRCAYDTKKKPPAKTGGVFKYKPVISVAGANAVQHGGTKNSVSLVRTVRRAEVHIARQVKRLFGGVGDIKIVNH